MEKDGANQFEPKKKTSTSKDFHSELTRKLVKKVPVAHNEAVLYQYRKNCHNFELCYRTLETIQKDFILRGYI